MSRPSTSVVATPAAWSLIASASPPNPAPITQALRTLSRTERNEQIVALEERAAKLAPKITLPMMLFILPTVCLIAAGPAAIRLLEVFK